MTCMDQYQTLSVLNLVLYLNFDKLVGAKTEGVRWKGGRGNGYIYTKINIAQRHSSTHHYTQVLASTRQYTPVHASRH